MTIGSRRRVTRETLFRVIPEYADAPSKETAERLFERDKADIIGLGLDLRSETDPWDEAIVHYRIARTGGELPALDLTPAEYTVLLAASRAWDDASAGGAARRVRAKLLSLGQEADPDLVRRTPQGAVESLPVLTPLLEAVSARHAVTFRYRAASGAAMDRRVEPWIVGVHDGAWYVLGHDLDREATRIFRASRIESYPRVKGVATIDAPTDLDLAAAVDGAGHGASETDDAVLDLAPYKALTLRDRVGAAVDAPRITLPGCSRAEARRLVLSSSRWAVLTEPSAWRDEIAAVCTHIAERHARAVDPAELQSGTVRERAAIRTPSTSTDHLSRLISEASYVLSRGEAELSAMAAEFGITEKRLIEDLQILFVCGDLGAGWEDLIDAEWEDGWVRVRNADALQGPLRLSAPEVTALLAGLAALGTAGGEERALLASARDKLCAALGAQKEDDDEAAHAPVRTADGSGGEAATASSAAVGKRPEADGGAAQHLTRIDRIVARIQEALDGDAPLVLRYSPPDRPGTSVRRVRPLRLESSTGRAYLRAVDLDLAESTEEAADAERTFRTDRIVEIIDDPAGPAGGDAPVETGAAPGGQGAAPTTGQGSEPEAPSPGPSVASGADAEAEAAWLRLDPPAAWIAEAFGAAEVRDLGEGEGLIVRIDRPVRSALLDAVMEAAGAAELLMPSVLREEIALLARTAGARHRAPEPLG